MLSEAMVNRLKSMGATVIENTDSIVKITLSKNELNKNFMDASSAVFKFYELCGKKVIRFTIPASTEKLIMVFHLEPSEKSVQHPEVLSENCD